MRIYHAGSTVGCIIPTREFDGNFRATQKFDIAAASHEAKKANLASPDCFPALGQVESNFVDRYSSGPRAHHTLQ
jgi:hypothetical protein